MAPLPVAAQFRARAAFRHPQILRLRQHCMNVMWRNVLGQGILEVDGVSIFGLQADKTATRGTLE